MCVLLSISDDFLLFFKYSLSIILVFSTFIIIASRDIVQVVQTVHIGLQSFASLSRVQIGPKYIAHNLYNVKYKIQKRPWNRILSNNTVNFFVRFFWGSVYFNWNRGNTSTNKFELLYSEIYDFFLFGIQFRNLKKKTNAISSWRHRRDNSTRHQNYKIHCVRESGVLSLRLSKKSSSPSTYYNIGCEF